METVRKQTVLMHKAAKDERLVLIPTSRSDLMCPRQYLSSFTGQSCSLAPQLWNTCWKFYSCTLVLCKALRWEWGTGIGRKKKKNIPQKNTFSCSSPFQQLRLSNNLTGRKTCLNTGVEWACKATQMGQLPFLREEGGKVNRLQQTVCFNRLQEQNGHLLFI